MGTIQRNVDIINNIRAVARPTPRWGTLALGVCRSSITAAIKERLITRVVEAIIDDNKARVGVLATAGMVVDKRHKTRRANQPALPGLRQARYPQPSDASGLGK